MRLRTRLWIVVATLSLAVLGMGPGAEAAEKRIALVVGNAAYTAGALATPANDAGLLAQTLQAAGFDVIGARDLDEDALRRSLRDFVDKAAASGPDTVAFVYLAGYGLQLEGENYFAPVDLRVSTAADVGLRALRVSDYAKSLAALPLKARFVVLDAARRSPFTVPDKPLAGGLALTEAEPGSLVAFNAAPGTVGPEEKGPYGAYAQALVEMMREGGLQPGPLFDRVRLRVDAATKGAEVPWNADRTGTPFVFFERAADAPPADHVDRVASLRDRPLRELGARDAYALAVERDDLAHYQDFLAAYPDDALARRVRALVAARREALVWRRTWAVGTPDAYWSYLDRYPRGPHAWDARRRLASLAAAYDPPPRFAAIAYDVPPPLPDEIVYVDRPVLYLDDPAYALPPPPPVVFLPPPPAYLVALPPPPPVVGLYLLPAPPLVPVPAYVSAPAYVVPPPNNVVFQNIHNATVIEQINHQNTIAPAMGAPGMSAAPVVAGAVAGAALGATAARVALPAALQTRAAVVPGAAPAVGAPAAPIPGRPGAPVPVQPGMVHALPGIGGQPLPGRPGMPAAPAPAAAGRSAPVPAPAAAARPGQAPQPQMQGPRPNLQAMPLRGGAPPAALDARRQQEMGARRAAAQQAAAQRQQMAVQRQQQMGARQQAMQAQHAQQMAARQQQMMAQRQQMMAQRQQMMMQQQMMARQQRAQAFAPRPMMAPHPVGPAPAPRPAPAPAARGGGHPPCYPGHPCR